MNVNDKWNFDLCGREIKVGNTIAVAAQAGYSVVMRIGEVLELNELKGKVKVDYSLSGSYTNPDRPVWIEDANRKSIVLPPKW